MPVRRGGDHPVANVYKKSSEFQDRDAPVDDFAIAAGGHPVQEERLISGARGLALGAEGHCLRDGRRFDWRSPSTSPAAGLITPGLAQPG